MRPQPDTHPISEVTMELPSGGHIRGVTELYFPFNFKHFSCKVTNFDIKLKNMRQMEVLIDFMVDGDQTIDSELYKDEAWKISSTENFLKFRDFSLPQLTRPAPVFALMLNKYLRVADATLKIDGKDSVVAFDQSPDLLVLPESYPPNETVPEEENYVYYNKKATVFYADFELGKKYSINIQFESVASHFEFAPLFPYKNTSLAKVNILPTDELEYYVMSFNLKPEISKAFPEWVDYKLERKRTIGDPHRKRPNFIPALPFRGEDVLFPPNGTYGMPDFSSIDDIPDDFVEGASEIENKELNDYASVRLVFGVMIPPDKNTEIIIRASKNPLPSRIYDQIQSLPAYDDVLIEYDIFNLSKKKIRLKIETEILGITDKSVKRTIIHGINNGQHQKARGMIRDCPRLKAGILKTITSPIKATLHSKVTDEDTREILHEETTDVEFLPHDQMVWSLKDVRNSNGYNLAPFIGAWIYPNDVNGYLDKIRSASARLHPDNAFGHECDSLDGIKAHVKAVYEHLTAEGFTYVSQSFTSRAYGESQRVVLPEKVIENKCGNCIDLTVLFASILEGVGIQSLIFLTPDHAFVGWGNPYRTDEMLILETTMIGNATFEQAIEAGKETFKKEFLFIGSDNPLPNDLTYHSKGCQIVQLKEIRSSGINAKVS